MRYHMAIAPYNMRGEWGGGMEGKGGRGAGVMVESHETVVPSNDIVQDVSGHHEVLDACLDAVRIAPKEPASHCDGTDVRTLLRRSIESVPLWPTNR